MGTGEHARTALVTGGGRGIGKAIALELGRAGFDVAVTYRSGFQAAAGTAQAIEALGRRAAAFNLDVGDPEDIGAVVSEVWQSFGAIDAVVNNAGAHTRTSFLDLDIGSWNRVLAVDLTGPAFVSQAVARLMVEHSRPGAMLNVGSINGVIAYPNLAHYCAAKGGLHMLTRAMALELAPHDIRVNAVAPGLIQTDLTAPLIDDPVLLQGKLDRIPLNRIGQPLDVARLAVYLLGEQSAWMTGNVVLLDGGQHIH